MPVEAFSVEFFPDEGDQLVVSEGGEGAVHVDEIIIDPSLFLFPCVAADSGEAGDDGDKFSLFAVFDLDWLCCGREYAHDGYHEYAGQNQN